MNEDSNTPLRKRFADFKRMNEDSNTPLRKRLADFKRMNEDSNTPLRKRLADFNRMNEDSNTPLRKRLADLEVRRKTLIEAMSKYQDAKKSALFRCLKENSEEETFPSPVNENFGDVRSTPQRGRTHYCQVPWLLDNEKDNWIRQEIVDMKKAERESFSHLSYQDENDAPSDESISYDNEGDDRNSSPIADKNNHLINNQSKTNVLMELNNIKTDTKATNLKGDNESFRNEQNDAKISSESSTSPPGGKFEVEDQFLKLFIDEDNIGPGKCSEVENVRLNKHEFVRDETTRTNARLGGEARSMGVKSCTDNMKLLERKLNMMISKKPLWQKALDDLYDDGPYVSKSASSETTLSGVMKPPSEAESICSVDDSAIVTQPASTHYYEKKIINNGSSESKTNIEVSYVQNNGHTITNEGEKVAEIDAIESWRTQNVLSNDPLPKDAHGVVATAGITSHCQAKEENIIDSDDSLKAKSDITGTETNENHRGSITAIDTIESQSIQNVKEHDDTSRKSLSAVHNSLTIEEKRGIGFEIEIEYSENAEIEAKIESFRDTEKKQIEQQCRDQEVSRHSERGNIHMDNTEEDSIDDSETQKDPEENSRREMNIASSRIVRIEDDDEQVDVLNTEQQCIKDMHLQSNSPDEINTEAPPVDEMKNNATLLGKEPIVSTNDEFPHIKPIPSQLNQQKIKLEPSGIVLQTKEQMGTIVAKKSTICSQVENRSSIELKNSRSSGIKYITTLGEDKVLSPHTQPQSTQSVCLQSNPSEVVNIAADLKTPPVSNSKKQFFCENDKTDEYFCQIDKFCEPGLLQDQNETDDPDSLARTKSPQNQKIHRSGDFVCGAASDLTEDSLASLESSPTGKPSDEQRQDINHHGYDGIDEQDSEESQTKAPIPNEVTMLTDFTIQSFTYTSNNSIIESLGEESLVRGIQSNGKPASHVVGSSNSQSTIIAERSNRQRNAGILQVIKPETSYTEGLMNALKQSSTLCQCTGPDLLNGVAASCRKSLNNDKQSMLQNAHSSNEVQMNRKQLLV